MAILPFNIYFFIGDELKGDVLELYTYTDVTINHLANITLNTTSSQTINGTTTISIAPEESVDIVSDNTNWKII
jgi:hypothetical protein